MRDRTWSVVAVGVTVERLAPLRVATLRLRGFDSGVLHAVSHTLDLAIPTRPNTSSGRLPRALCLAPGEWMIVGYAGRTDAVIAAAVRSKVAHLVDAGEGMVSYAVSGPIARDLLSKGCTLDLHPRVFASGACAQTLFAQVGIVLEHRPGGDCVLHASASYAHHLQTWFADAAIEFGSKAFDRCRHATS